MNVNVVVPVQALPHFIGAVAALSLTVICLLIFSLFKTYRLVGSVALLFGALSVHLAGMTVWSAQASPSAIIMSYRALILGLVWIPVGWVLVISAIAEVSYPRLVWSMAALSTALSVLCLAGTGPWLVSEPLIPSSWPGLVRPTSHVLRLVASVYPLLVGLGFTFFFLVKTRVRLEEGGEESAAFIPALLALGGYVAGGVHDVSGALFSHYTLFNGPVQWLACLWLAFWLAMATMIRFKEVERSLISRTEDLITARTVSMLGSCSVQVAGWVNEYLNNLATQLSFLEADEISPGARATIETIRQGADRLSVFTRRLSRFADRPHLDFRLAGLERRLRDILEGLQGAIAAKEVKITLTGLSGLNLRADWNLLDRVFEILLSNSLEAVGQRGRIEVRADWSSTGPVVIEVVDDGPGPAPGELGALEQPLLSPVDETTGMNQLMIRNIVEAHGGTAAMEPGPGGGRLVRLSLPARPPMERLVGHG